MILGVTALLDANILYSACLRDFLLRLAAEHLYRPLWSAQIQDEWTGRLLVDRPDLTKAQTDYTTGQMDKYFGDARVIGYGHLVEQVHLPDPDDRHVLAAAIQGGAHRIVTWNLKDFPLDCTLRYSIEAQCPDDFVMELLDASPSGVARAARNHRLALRNPARSAEEHLVAYEEAGLSRVVARLAAGGETRVSAESGEAPG